MPFEKGNKESKGRPKGTPNKTTADNRERVNKVISKLYDEYLDEDLETIGASERVKTLIALMEYSLPKLQRISHIGENEAAIKVKMDLSNLSDDELKSLKGIVTNATGDKSGTGEA